MIARVKNRKFIMADFETSTEAWLARDNGEARVWLWGQYDPFADKFEWGINIDDFLIKHLTLKNDFENPIIYFHNLKFDGSYIVNWLFRNGYEFDPDLTKAKTFNTCITDMGLWHYVEVCIYRNGRIKKVVRFQDSLKKIPMPVQDIPFAFGFADEMRKGDIDYDKYRPVGYQPDADELYYLERDCKIPARALLQLEQEGFTKMTCASDSAFHWKESLQSQRQRERHFSPELQFRRLYPLISLDADDFIRGAYRGGWTYVNPKYQDKILHNLRVYDINSMYPAKMRDKYLPIGDPIYFEGQPKPNKYQCYIVKIMIAFEIKPNHLPCIQLKNSYFFNPTDYVTSSKGCEIEMTVTNIDLALIYKQYDILSIKYIGGYYFRKCKGMFTEYIDTNMKIKEISTGGKRYLAKMRMNSVYGKTATSPRRRQKIPYLEDGVLKFSLSEEEVGEPEYTALGVFITSHARHDIILDAQRNYDNFVYCDTDSLHLLATPDGNPPDLPIHQSHIGYYKLEKNVSKGVFLRSKTYIEEDYSGNVEIKCAGANPIVKKGMNFDNFKVGNSFKGKLVPKQVKGGCVLINSTFTIK